MKPAIEEDFSELVDIIESFTKKLETMPLKDKVDLAARLKPLTKNCELIDEHVKELVKVKLRHESGEVKGELFKAELTIVPVDRLDQKRLKEEKPTIHSQFVRTYHDERVSFKLR